MVFFNPSKANKTATFALQDAGLFFFGGYEMFDVMNHNADLGVRDINTKFKYNVPTGGQMWYFVPHWNATMTDKILWSSIMMTYKKTTIHLYL